MSIDENGNVVCICQNEFCLVVAEHAYLEHPGGVFCDVDECEAFVDANDLVYHCGNDLVHGRGFDICLACMERLSAPTRGESPGGNSIKNNINDKHLNNSGEGEEEGEAEGEGEKNFQNTNNNNGEKEASLFESSKRLMKTLKEQHEKRVMKNVSGNGLSLEEQLDLYNGNINCDSITLTYYYGKNKYHFYAERDVFSKGCFKMAYRAVMHKSEVRAGAYGENIKTPRIADWTNVVLKKKYKTLDKFGQFKKAQPIMNRGEWATDLNELERLGNYCQEWNKNKFSDKTYEASKAYVLKVSDEGISGTGQFKKDEYLLVEPFMPHFAKWNWPNGAEKFAKSLSIQAFGHFTYHYSNGKELVNDAQGYRDDNKYILTDPYYVSGNDRRCIEWFNDHECNKFCKSWWKRPNNVECKQFVAISNYVHKKADGIRHTCLCE